MQKAQTKWIQAATKKNNIMNATTGGPNANEKDIGL